MFFLFVIGRLIFGGYFLYNGINHFRNIESIAAYAATKSVPSPKTFVQVTGGLLLFGGISVILGFIPFLGLLCLVLFLVPVTFMMHSFWKDTDPQVKMGNRINFGKNLALLGATLILFIIPRPWPNSLLHWDLAPWDLCGNLIAKFFGQ